MRTTKPLSTPNTASHAAHTSPPSHLRIDSTTLMGGQKVLEIVHQGEVYRLQTTRLGKLILTK